MAGLGYEKEPAYAPGMAETCSRPSERPDMDVGAGLSWIKNSNIDARDGDYREREELGAQERARAVALRGHCPRPSERPDTDVGAGLSWIKNSNIDARDGDYREREELGAQ